jgi:oligo-1,6-glucosidase
MSQGYAVASRERPGPGPCEQAAWQGGRVPHNAASDGQRRPSSERSGGLRPAGWWKSAVVYQIYPRSFQDSDGDGVGDIRGITSRLDYLAQLGVDVVWLSPVYTSPMDDNGYDISDYEDVDPLFGSLADLDELIAAAHERGIRLVMDLVVNHTSDEHPWFRESRDPGSDKRDWYWWRPARPGCRPGTPGAEPNNWESTFSGSAWEYDERSGEYYLHLFSRKQPDLNWENPAVRQAVYAMMRRWVGRGVDGFRMDVINLISKDAALPDGEVPDGRRYAPAERHVANGPRLHEFLQEMNREVGLDAHELLTVGEMPGSTLEVARVASDPARGELSMVFTFEHVWLDQQPGLGKWALAPLPLPVLKANLDKWQRGLADRGWNSLYWDNHDQPRAVSRFGDDSPEHRVASAKTLGTVLHLHRGTPYVYQGEELGMTNSSFTDISQYRDIEALNYHRDAVGLGMQPGVVMAALAAKGRDNARTPMQWDDSEHAGFTTGDPWLPANPNKDTVNAAAAAADPGSVFHHYRRLIELRHRLPVVVDGRFELLLAEDERLWVFTRTTSDEVLLVVANCSSEPAPVDWSALPDVSGGELLLGTHERCETPHAERALRAWESLVYRLDRRG